MAPPLPTIVPEYGGRMPFSLLCGLEPHRDPVRRHKEELLLHAIYVEYGIPHIKSLPGIRALSEEQLDERVDTLCEPKVKLG
jgi:hypothetical protein